ncbi:MAG: twin transmembrane helix small protein [Gammaproteobacteria bacterium]
MFKGLVILLLAAILVSLFSGLFFLNRDKSDSRRTLRALTVRISLSVLLFVVLLIGWWTGAIQPHDVMNR